jgi:hypothetical protein
LFPSCRSLAKSMGRTRNRDRVDCRRCLCPMRMFHIFSDPPSARNCGISELIVNR